jgi:16S rRNA (cytosine1402-N4)-methyltransferase
MKELHQPVLLSEVLSVLAPQPGESYMDLTAGYAGHASEILDVTQNYKDSVLVDRDENAIQVLKARYENRPLRIMKADFYSAVLQEIECGNAFDMILMDFGVSSPQLDRAERGFSFSKDGPLDMRMDQGQDLTAERIVNKWSERDLVEILEKYGEEKPGFAKLIARAIIHGRPWSNTKELGDALAKYGRGGKVHPATRTFQAIRIAVNDELGQIERTLELLPKVLKPGGRVAIITFHSLEDRLVKDWMREASGYGEESEIRILTKKPITAEMQELFINPRARSAKLRAAIKR